MIIQSKFPIAYNVGPRRGFLFFAADSNFDIAKGEGPKYVPAYSGDSIPGDTIDDFNVGENFKVYKDNMVQPNLVDLAKEQFDEIVKEFVDYINNGGFDKLTNVTIQGRADSANPTWDIPAGETSLDHSYGGIKRKSNYTDDELDQMNLYLARERAKNYKNKLIKEIKTQTGKEITIKELEPISYRGQQNRRGGQWRSILLVANAPTLEVINIDPIKKKEYEDYLKTKEEKDKELSSGLYPVEVGVGVLGDGIWLETSKGEQPFALSKTEPYPTGDFTTTSVFIRQDIIEEYKIPDYPNRAISTAKFEFNTESPKLSFIDGNGNTQNFDLYSYVYTTGLYYPGFSDIEVTINANIKIGSNSKNIAAFIVSGFTSRDTVKIINNGFIVGYGGNGGNGQDLGKALTADNNGENGGDAIFLNYPVTIVNNNVIAGGGGGGGGGLADFSDTSYLKLLSTSNSQAVENIFGGGGGGGGAGIIGEQEEKED
jgi:hypothetical protein